MIDYIINKFKEYGDREALLWNDKSFSYTWIKNEVDRLLPQLKNRNIRSGTVIELHADYSPSSIALLVSMIKIGCIIVPTTQAAENKRDEFLRIAGAEISVRIDTQDNISYQHLPYKSQNATYEILRYRNSSGLVLFSSGSTGSPKAAVHDFSMLLEKYKTIRPAKRIINFLLFDHIGGINTLFHTLSNGGCVIAVNERNPNSVCEAITKHKANVLPTTPTFLNLILLNKCYSSYDLSSLELITYGTEVMPESTLTRLNIILPNIKISQTYGLSEIGILRAKSKSSDSLFMKVGGDGIETRIVNGLLEVKTRSAMLGYLNADSPFTEDGWFQTGDAVELDGEYLKILGRKSDIINVGGEKVYPAEVESTLQQMIDVEDVSVTSAPHPITGHIVVAHIKLNSSESLQNFRVRMREFCKDRIASFKIPQKVVLMDTLMHSHRFKKLRKAS